ncbi:MAG: GntR family transcriptional regulator [Anaerolineae bacterium]|nr:GntR family transcriptional regulator [Anaerolineae bacterium]
MTLDGFSIQIDKDSPVPIYFQIYQGIVALIAAGSLKPGDALPSETDLSRHFKVSPMTVRQAMAEMVKHGFVRRERGRGTFVTARHLDHPLDRLVSFTEDMQARRLVPSARILLIEQVAAPADVIIAAGLPADAEVLHLKRLRLANDEPVGLHNAFLNGVAITADDLARTPSLYSLLAQRGIVLARGTDVIEAVSADKEVAELLRIKPNAPLLRTTRLAWDDRGRFVEYVVALYRADLYHYRTHLSR